MKNQFCIYIYQSYFVFNRIENNRKSKLKSQNYDLCIYSMRHRMPCSKKEIVLPEETQKSREMRNEFQVQNPISK